MPKYSAREQSRHRRWQEQQRNKKQVNITISKKEERSAVEMGNDLRSMLASSIHSVILGIDTPRTAPTAENLEAQRREQERLKREEEAERQRQIKEREQKAKEALDRIATLPGMAHIKAQVEQFIALKKVSEKRKAAGLKTERQTLHMIFTGNPGTGKTTVARLIGEAFINLGLLKSEHDIPPFVEVHLNDVESPYIGKAEENMTEKFKEARGGVLFMDEAYSFGGHHQHNKTFLANLVSLIEDMRDEVLVIAAGYNEEMQEFLDTNPGLRSRFSSVIDFPDYEVGHLLEIADIMAKERDYDITGPYRTQLLKRIEGERKLDSFGNARTIRNIIEQSIRIHSIRMMGLENPTKDQLMSLTAVDIDMEVRIPPRRENKSGGAMSHIIMVTESKNGKEPFRPGEGPFH